MKDLLVKIIKDTLDTGIGQSIIAFAAWGYVAILIIIFLYYAVLSLIRLFSHNKS